MTSGIRQDRERVAASGGSAQRGAGRRVARVWLPGAGRIVSRDSTFVCGAGHSVQNRVVEKWGLCVNPERIPSHTPLRFGSQGCPSLTQRGRGEHLFWIHTQFPPPDFGLSACWTYIVSQCDSRQESPPGRCTPRDRLPLRAAPAPPPVNTNTEYSLSWTT